MASWSFNYFDLIKYNNNVYEISQQTSPDNETPQYTIRDWLSSEIIENVDENELASASVAEIVSKFWEQFVFDGDTSKASSEIFNKLIIKLKGANNISFGVSSDNLYAFTCNGQT